MKLYFTILFILQILVGNSQTAVPEQNTAPYLIEGSVLVDASEEEIKGRMNRAWKYSFGQEPAAKLLDKGNDKMLAKAHFYFQSVTVTGRQETRGIISYNVVLTAKAGKCGYTIDQFVHRGNTTSRIGGIHFGRLMKGLFPERKVRGLGKKNVERIHTDMKKQVEARIAELVKIFEQQLLLTD